MSQSPCSPQSFKYRVIARPRPDDVLAALDDIRPGARIMILGPSRKAEVSAARRTAQALCVAFGHKHAWIAKSFRRKDHTTIISNVKRYQKGQALGLEHSTDEARLFRLLWPKAIEIAQRRAMRGVVEFPRSARRAG